VPRRPRPDAARALQLGILEKLRDSSFREDFEAARAEIAATDALIRALEGARAGRGITKAELAGACASS
jgi:hypothetical protein